MRNFVNLFSIVVAIAVLIVAALMYTGVLAVANRGRIVILVILALMLLAISLFQARRNR